MSARTLLWDWYPGTVPDNVEIDETAYVETTFSFHLYRSTRDVGVSYGRGASSYLGTMFDVGPTGQVRIGDYSLVHGVRFICDSEIVIGSHALISWNVVMMDSYRVSMDPAVRREQLRAVARDDTRALPPDPDARPIDVGPNVWIGFDAIVLPGVTIGEGSIVGARSVVATDVPPYTVVAGNPATPIRQLERTDGHVDA